MLAVLKDCKLSIDLWPLSSVMTLGVFASSSREIWVFQTEQLYNFLVRTHNPCITGSSREEFTDLVLSQGHFLLPHGGLPLTAVVYCKDKWRLRRIHLCGMVASEKLINPHRTSLLVLSFKGLGLEGSLKAILLTFPGLGSSLCEPYKKIKQRPLLKAWLFGMP